MKWYKVPGDLKPGSPFIKKVNAGNKNICLVGYEGEVFALAAKCPHAGGDLSLGWCDNEKIVCPVHRYSYDLQTGKGSKGQNDFINTYPVKIIDEEFYIGISSLSEKFINLFRK
jgi:nitrite reductase/ring-hydroxylating ferredoxin subunit